MFGGLLKAVFNANEREVRRLRDVAHAIGDLEPQTQAASDADLRARTAEFRSRLDRGESLDDLLVEAFAVVREAARRVLGLRPFDVQLMGGVVLHEGRIAEMKTGEGKTLVATLPAYLNALTGHGVHVVTVNDYLARRDSEWMGQILRFLGLQVGLIVHEFDSPTRRRNYLADVVYGTNHEFGFDYLRDNMAFDLSEVVQRQLHFGIVDEVDSILVDEARTPLIISWPMPKPTEQFYRFARLVEQFQPDEDYTLDEKLKTVAPTESGVHKIERALQIGNLFDLENMQLSHYLENALKAKSLFHRDKEYIVKDGEVVLVDEFTGRQMLGRRYSHGLHEAIEAKENCQIAQGSQTMATITLQNFFRLYAKLAGMTGTALTEEEEFHKIYKLDVVVIPTHLPMVRRDLPDVIYKSEAAKFRAVVREIKERHSQGQPVLVGTVDIAKSERLAGMLDREGIPHQVLNAKHHDKEAQIIAQAGRYGTVTIATNMAGRGTDILLGGNPEYLARQRLLQEGHVEELVALAAENVPPPLPGAPPPVIAGEAGVAGPESGPSAISEGGPGALAVAGALPTATEVQRLRERYLDLTAAFRKQTEAEHAKVVEAGGLHVTGTERHEARRIDNQLRGRSGRQGDPGTSRFYLSLEDDLMRLFGSERIRAIMDRLGVQEDEPIESPLVTRAIETAQRRVESNNFDARKHILDFDDVMNQQREVIYAQRRRILEQADCHEIVGQMLEDVCKALADAHCPESADAEDWDLTALLAAAQQYFLPPGPLEQDLSGLTRQGLTERLLAAAAAGFGERQALLGPEAMQQLERHMLLVTVNQQWIEHLEAMDDLREGIQLRAYGQLDPLSQYRIEAYDMFQEMVQHIREDVVRLVYRLPLMIQLTPDQQAELERQRDQARRSVVAEMAGVTPAATVVAAGAGAARPGPAAARGGPPAQTDPAPAPRPGPGTVRVALPQPVRVPPPGATGRDGGAVPRVGRNDPCPCGSGKKYKHCHGR